MLFIQRFIDQAHFTPDAPAIVDSVFSISYRELYGRALDLAQVIAATTSGFMIGVLMEKGVDCIVSILAVHLSGRTVVPLDSSYPAERLKQMISVVDLALCLVNRELDPELGRMLDQHTRLMQVDEPAPPSTGDVVDFSPKFVDKEAAYVVFTSGTTGRPKPVMVPYRSLSALVGWMVSPAQPIGCTLLYAAQGFDVSFQEIYSGLCQGDRLLIIRDAQKKDLHALTELMSTEAVTRVFLPTSMLIPLVTFDLYQHCPLSALAQVIVAGEQLKITRAVRQWFEVHPHCRLINHYGPSETHVVMEHRLDGPPRDWPDLPPIGQVVPQSSAYLFDEQLQPVAPGSSGQLYISGRSLALGYYRMPEETAEKFVRHPVTGEGLYSTGDVCVLNPQGLYEYKGRRDQQYKVRGYRVELKEIEAVVADSGLVDDCLVVARQSGLTTSLILYFTADDSGQDISLSLHAYLLTRLPDYMLPSFYKRIAAIPLTQNGKADIEKLPQVTGLRSQWPSTYVPPQDELESLVCAVTASSLGLDRVGANDNFMALGANSITLISLLAELRYALAQDLRQTDLFEFPSPRQLCTSLGFPGDAPPRAASVVSTGIRIQRSAAISSIQGRRRN